MVIEVPFFPSPHPELSATDPSLVFVCTLDPAHLTLFAGFPVILYGSPTFWFARFFSPSPLPPPVTTLLPLLQTNQFFLSWPFFFFLPQLGNIEGRTSPRYSPSGVGSLCHATVNNPPTFFHQFGVTFFFTENDTPTIIFFYGGDPSLSTSLRRRCPLCSRTGFFSPFGTNCVFPGRRTGAFVKPFPLTPPRFSCA